jgi:adenylate kinase family enzyme
MKIDYGKYQAYHKGSDVFPDPMTKSSLTYVVGAPGSGKTTYAMDLSKEKGYHHLEMDALTQKEPTEKNSHARELPLDIITKIRKAGTSVIISGVSTNWEDIAKLSDKVILMHTKPEDIVRRAELRKKQTGHGLEVEVEKWKKWAEEWYQGDQFKKLQQFADKLEIIEPTESNEEKCDICGRITTKHVAEGEGYGRKKDKIPLLYHFHGSNLETICLECSGLKEEDWKEAREKTDPKLIYPESKNATWLEKWGDINSKKRREL